MAEHETPQSSKRIAHPIVFVFGSTGAGKTAICLSIASHAQKCGLLPHVINADVMQMCVGLPIATNKPSDEEMAGIPHHFLSFLREEEVAKYSVSRFVVEATSLIDRLFSGPDGDRVVVLVCGGTTYYIQSLMIADTLVASVGDEIKDDDPATERAPPQQTTLDGGEQATLWQQLHAVDPDMAAIRHPSDTRRIARSLEIFRTTNKPHSQWLKEEAPYARYTSERTLALWVDFDDRGRLFQKLDRRVDEMVSRGLIQEVQDFFAKRRSVPTANPPTKEHAEQQEGSEEEEEESTASALRGLDCAIGCREFREAMCRASPPTQEELGAAVVALKQHTRRYARQQQRWVLNRLVNRYAAQGVIQNLFRFSCDGCRCDPLQDAAIVFEAWASGESAESLVRQRPWVTSYSSSAGNPPPSAPVLHTCELCSRAVCGDAQWQTHLSSRGHRQAVRRQQLEESLRSRGIEPHTKKRQREANS